MTDQEFTPEQDPAEIVEPVAPEIAEPEVVAIAEPVADPIAEPEVISVIKVDPKKEKGAMPVPAAMVSIPEPAGPAVVGNDLVDPVYLSKAIYKNAAARKSLTVHHLQRRLAELGYSVAYGDKDGWYGDGTQLAIEKFRADNGIKVEGHIDDKTFLEIFKGDPNVDPIV